MEKNIILKNKVYFLLISISGLFLLLDQFLKYFARTYFINFYLWKPYLGWEYFENSGIAFGLPFPNALLIIFTPLIILGLFVLISKQKKRTNIFILGVLLIIFGAVSNLIDRIIFASTIDYIRILTSIINLADVMIVAGAVMLVVGSKKVARQ